MITVLGDGTLARAIRANVIREPVRDLIWVAYDNPVNDWGVAADGWVIDRTRLVLDKTSAGTIVLLSSQLPVGTCARFESWYPRLRFAVHPENLRAATAETDFANQARVVIGAREDSLLRVFASLFEPFTRRILFMSPESAEMVKHALNGFLALSVEYANEVAMLARKHGADAIAVIEAVMADPRIGHDAYLRPDREPGPHLLREVRNLEALGGGRLIEAIR